MAKAQAMKPKSPFGGVFGKLFGAKEKKPAARPTSAQSSTMTNLPAQAASKPPARVARAEKPSGWTLADLRLPIIGSKPLTTQLQVLGSAAALIGVFIAIVIFDDFTTRNRNATYV